MVKILKNVDFNVDIFREINKFKKILQLLKDRVII